MAVSDIRNIDLICGDSKDISQSVAFYFPPWVNSIQEKSLVSEASWDILQWSDRQHCHCSTRMANFIVNNFHSTQCHSITLEWFEWKKRHPTEILSFSETVICLLSSCQVLRELLLVTFLYSFIVNKNHSQGNSNFCANIIK